MKLSSGLISVALLGLAGAAPDQARSPLDRRQSNVPNQRFIISSFKSSGNGCPEGSYSLQYASEDPMNPNMSGVTASYDEPFYLVMTDEDRARYASLGRVERFCRHELEVKYPVGCLESRINITTNGIFLHDVPDEVEGFIDRQFELESPEFDGDPRPSQELRAQPGWGKEGTVWTLQDWIKDEQMIMGKVGDSLMTKFAVNLTLAMWSDNMNALEQSYMRVDDTSIFFVMREFSEDCWGTGGNLT